MHNKTIVVVLVLSTSLLIWSCQSNRPTTPSKIISLNVSIPPTDELKSSLLGAGSNELLYRVDSPGIAPLKGTIGPFSTAASSGSIDFSLNIPSGVPSILSIQINNAGTHQPLAIGATKIDLASASPVTDMVVEMGSVTRNCYYVNDALSYAYYTYGFKNDTLANSLTTGPSYDLQVEYQGLTSGAYVFYLADASGNTPTPNSIAYMGTGKLVDYDKVPADSQFGAASTLTKTAAMGVTTTSFVESGDIYCIKLNTISGGHAWIQIVNPGSFPTCSTFIFRTNSSLPYYGYEQTAADVTSTCSGTW